MSDTFRWMAPQKGKSGEPEKKDQPGRGWGGVVEAPVGARGEAMAFPDARYHILVLDPVDPGEVTRPRKTPRSIKCAHRKQWNVVLFALERLQASYQERPQNAGIGQRGLPRTRMGGV